MLSSSFLPPLPPMVALTSLSSSSSLTSSFFFFTITNSNYPYPYHYHYHYHYHYRPPPRRISIAAKQKPSPSSTFISTSTKIVRCPALDRHAAKHSRLRFVRKLTTLLLSKPRHFLPLRVLARCRHYLTLPPSRPLLPMILRYPALFRLFRSPSPASPYSSSLLSVALTPAAESLAAALSAARARLAAALADKLHRLLMLAPRRRLLLAKLVHLAPDLGLPPDFRGRLCHAHPTRFRVVDTSYGPALELVAWDPALAVPAPPLPRSSTTIDDEDDLDRPIIDRPRKFKHLTLRRGLNLKRRHRDYLIRLRDLPDVSPYAAEQEDGEQRRLTSEEEEKRACAVVREVLAMTVEKRTLVDHLTHFRKDFGLPNRLMGMLVRHPEMFYVSVKGVRHSVFLVEAYDHKGKLIVEDELLQEKERLMELVTEGKRMRRERKKDTGYGHDSDQEEDNEEEEDGDGEDDIDDDNDFQDLFELGVQDDWEEFGDLVDDGGECGGEHEINEFWVKKAAAVASSDNEGRKTPEAW